ncbi:hypothetical protein F5Y08DRAFT_301662 [Xylaria arbuscula]|nr:hypothetical protein F5Y08DRAFT_301662 [Xylaria arbuscula]
MPSMSASVLSTLRDVIPYAPIPLFAENLRTHRSLLSAMLSPYYLPECVTGSVRDFRTLWDINYWDVFGNEQSNPSLVTTSMRHGNSFEAANSILLEASGIVRPRLPPTPGSHMPKRVFRETVVNLSFVTVTCEQQPFWNRWQSYVLVLIFSLMVAVQLTGAIFAVRKDLLVGASLLLCITILQVLEFALRASIYPIFGNQHALASDKARTARQEAALDVHILAKNWNATSLSVACGYSSHLHALTNIPVRITRPILFRWLCRALAIVLTVQAALLASVTNADGDARWASLIWLAGYVLNSLLKQALYRVIGQENLLAKQGGVVNSVQPLHFSGHMAALAFIALLPASHKADSWAWCDAFMPNNGRRQQFQDQIQRLEQYQIARTWQNRLPSDQVLFHQRNYIDDTIVGSALDEALEAFCRPGVTDALNAYFSTVYPDCQPAKSEV